MLAMTLTLVLGTLFVILLLLAVGLILYARWHYGELEALGIPVVKPFLIFGSNYNEPYIHNYEEDIRRREKYGLIYGVYDGRRPQIYISDPKLIRQICTVDFDHFQNHDPNQFIISSERSSVLEEILDSLRDEKWRTVRAALTPMFTGSRIKQASPAVREIAGDYVECLMAKLERGCIRKFNFKKFSVPMIVEALAKTFGGIEIPDAKEEDNVFIKQIQMAVFDEIPTNNWKSLIPKVFPFLLPYVSPAVSNPGFDYMLEFLENIFKVREQQLENGPKDALQILLQMKKRVWSDEDFKRLQITENLILAQAWEYFWAGYTGLRDILDLLLYELSGNDGIQEKVFQEIMEYDKNHNGRQNELSYLGACILEVTRMYPGFLRPEIVCNKNWEYEGLRIPKGVQIMFPTNAIHFNPDNYPEPYLFQPERFLGAAKEKRDPYTLMTFGQGPRTCIAYRFALEMIKVLAVQFLKRFRFERRKDSSYKPIPGGTFIVSYEPLYLDLIKR